MRSELGSLSWTIKYTFNTLKTHKKKTINKLHLIMVFQPKNIDSTNILKGFKWKPSNQNLGRVLTESCMVILYETTYLRAAYRLSA